MSIADKAHDLLRRTKVWLSTGQITERLGTERKYVHGHLCLLVSSGEIERRAVGRESEWRAREKIRNCVPAVDM